jgi:hypothetical protein
MNMVRQRVPEAKTAAIDVVPKQVALPLPYTFDQSGLSSYLAGAGGVPFTPVWDAVPEIAQHYRQLLQCVKTMYRGDVGD